MAFVRRRLRVRSCSRQAGKRVPLGCSVLNAEPVHPSPICNTQSLQPHGEARTKADPACRTCDS